MLQIRKRPAWRYGRFQEPVRPVFGGEQGESADFSAPPLRNAPCLMLVSAQRSATFRLGRSQIVPRTVPSAQLVSMGLLRHDGP